MDRYELVKKPIKDRGKFKVTIVADSNDADYITTITKYLKKDFEDYILDGLLDLQINYGGRHQLSIFPNDYDLDIPYNGCDGHCHTLERIDVEYIDENGEVWNVFLKY